MSNFYYTILKAIQEENPLRNRIIHYISQYLLILIAISLIFTSIYYIKHPYSKSNFYQLLYFCLPLICLKIYNLNRINQAQLLAKIAQNIKNKYDLDDLTLLRDELENYLNKTNEILKWVSLIIASVFTLMIGQIVNLYLKSLDFLTKEKKDEFVQELFKLDFFYIMNSILIPITLLITAYILFIFFFAQLFNHNKRLTLLVLRNCNYSLLEKK